MGGIKRAFGGGGGEEGRKGAAAATAASDAIAEANREATAEIRRQFDITQEQLQPFVEAGTRQLPIQEERATVEGLDAILGQIFGGESFQNLRDERTRSIEGQLAAGGLTRSGTALQEAANIPTDIGFQIEQLLTGRSGALAGQGQGTAVQVGQFGARASGDIAGITQETGAARSSGILAGQQAKAAARQQATENLQNTASIFFSDPALKENVEQIGDNGDLKLYQWDWIPETKGTMIEGCGNIGFMADEVKDKYPQHIYNFGGFMMIDYPPLLDELAEKNNQVIIDLELEEA